MGRRKRRGQGDHEDGPSRPPSRPTPRDELAQTVRDVVVAVVIVGIVFGGVMIYSQVWPPMVVIESSSMQHSGTESYVGVIDTGDLVFVQAARSKADVVTFLDGRNTGYQTYGDYGDVLIFRRISSERGRFLGGDPIIHRAMVYLEWDPVGGGFDVPALDGPGNAGRWGCVAASPGCTTARGADDLLGEIWISSPGWNFTVNLNERRDTGQRWSLDGQPYGNYVTKGDHNGNGRDSWVTPHEAIIGKARGEIPWFGLVKLTVAPTTSCCAYWGCVGTGSPCFATRNSWDALAVSLIVVSTMPFALDLGLAYRELRRKRRRRPERQAARA